MKKKIFLLIIFILIFFGLVFFLKPKKTIETQSFVDAGGHKLFYKTSGIGSPVVIFESGAGGDSTVWDKVAPEIAKNTKVLVYDRTGLGKSDMDEEPRSATKTVSQFNTLLTKAGINPPYILVGHSMGGIYVRVFQNKYPDKVAGMVLIDPGHEEMAQKTGQDFINELEKEVTQNSAGLSPGVKAEALSAVDIWNEVKAMNLKKTINIPLTVIASSKQLDLVKDEKLNSQANIILRDLQRQLAGQSVQGEYFEAQGSGHLVQLEKPQIVIDAIKTMIEKVRKEENKN